MACRNLDDYITQRHLHAKGGRKHWIDFLRTHSDCVAQDLWKVHIEDASAIAGWVRYRLDGPGADADFYSDNESVVATSVTWQDQQKVAAIKYDIRKLEGVQAAVFSVYHAYAPSLAGNVFSASPGDLVSLNSVGGVGYHATIWNPSIVDGVSSCTISVNEEARDDGVVTCDTVRTYPTPSSPVKLEEISGHSQALVGLYRCVGRRTQPDTRFEFDMYLRQDGQATFDMGNGRVTGPVAWRDWYGELVVGFWLFYLDAYHFVDPSLDAECQRG